MNRKAIPIGVEAYKDFVNNLFISHRITYETG